MNKCMFCNSEYEKTAKHSENPQKSLLCPACVNNERKNRMRKKIAKDLANKGSKNDSNLKDQLQNEEKIEISPPSEKEKFEDPQCIKKSELCKIFDDEKLSLKSAISDLNHLFEQQMFLLKKVIGLFKKSLQNADKNQQLVSENGKLTFSEPSRTIHSFEYDTMVSKIALLKIDLQTIFSYHCSSLLQAAESNNAKCKLASNKQKLFRALMMLRELNRSKL